MVRRVADEVYIPFTVGGGIRTLEDARRMLRAGADKVSVNTAAVERPELISEIAGRVRRPVRGVRHRRQTPRRRRVVGGRLGGVPARRADADRASTPSSGRVRRCDEAPARFC